MKKLLILLFSILISFNSYGEWLKIHHYDNGDVAYIDLNTIKKHGGYVYFWFMSDYLKPDPNGIMSIQMYVQGDCGVNRYKHLAFLFSKEPMGRNGDPSYTPPDDWHYPSPGTRYKMDVPFDYVCDYVD